MVVAMCFSASVIECIPILVMASRSMCCTGTVARTASVCRTATTSTRCNVWITLSTCAIPSMAYNDSSNSCKAFNCKLSTINNQL